MSRTTLTLWMAACAAVSAGGSSTAAASDHLDTPTVIGDPAADIGDLYAWMSPDGRRLNLVMTVVGKRFSDQAAYLFHVDSGRAAGATRNTVTIDCRFDATAMIRCEAAGDHAAGDAGGDQGMASERGRFQVFAGLRDDPFANNVRGTRQAYEVVEAALKAGRRDDLSGCPSLDSATVSRLMDRWRHTDGGPAQDFLQGWTTAALVVSIDVEAVSPGGPLLGVWAGVYALSGHAGDGDRAPVERVDRIGRTLTGNALIGPLDPREASSLRKEQYNRAGQEDWERFVPDLQRTLALYDAFDGVCGNQWLAGPEPAADRYLALARLLADDRLWVDSRGRRCAEFMTVESPDRAQSLDCGGRTPDGDAVDIFRSLLVNGTRDGVDDGVPADDRRHSSVDFPFLAEP